MPKNTVMSKNTRRRKIKKAAGSQAHSVMFSRTAQWSSYDSGSVSI